VGCGLEQQTQNVLVLNLPDPQLLGDPSALGLVDPENPNITNATLALSPGETGRITLRVLDPDRTDAVTAESFVLGGIVPAVVSQVVDTVTALRYSGGGTPPAPAPVSPLVVLTQSLPAAHIALPYVQALQAVGGTPPYSWSIVAGALPTGITLASSGLISGTPTTGGVHSFTVQVLDGATPAATTTRALQLSVTSPPMTVTFLTQPSAAIAGAAIAPAVRVLVRDGYALPVPGATVTLSLASNPTGAVLTGGSAMSDDLGIATFDALSVDRGGRGYTLHAVVSPTAVALSDAFNISGFRTGPTATPRVFAAAVPLDDGRILLAGGEAPSSLASAELYDPATETITPTGSLDTPRAAYAAARLLDGWVLVTGGGGVPYEATAELYDPTTGTFAPTTEPMAAGRAGHTATLLASGKVLVVGGGPLGGPLATAELFEPETGTFAPTGSLAGDRWGHTATRLLDGRVLIAGGNGSAGHAIASAQIYDPETGTFSSTGSMTVARNSHRAVLLPDGRVLMVGGSNDLFPPTVSTLEVYDPDTGVFTLAGGLITARSSASATLLSDGRVLIAGGSKYDVGMLDSAEIYDPATKTAVPAGDLASPRTMHMATLLPSGEVLVVGGASALGVYLTTTEIYVP
jgi:hypothetical protein